MEQTPSTPRTDAEHPVTYDGATPAIGNGPSSEASAELDEGATRTETPATADVRADGGAADATTTVDARSPGGGKEPAADGPHIEPVGPGAIDERADAGDGKTGLTAGGDDSAAPSEIGTMTTGFVTLVTVETASGEQWLKTKDQGSLHDSPGMAHAEAHVLLEEAEQHFGISNIDRLSVEIVRAVRFE